MTVWVDPWTAKTYKWGHFWPRDGQFYSIKSKERVNQCRIFQLSFLINNLTNSRFLSEEYKLKMFVTPLYFFNYFDTGERTFNSKKENIQFDRIENYCNSNEKLRIIQSEFKLRENASSKDSKTNALWCNFERLGDRCWWQMSVTDIGDRYWWQMLVTHVGEQFYTLRKLRT